MAKAENRINTGFHNYPQANKGPETMYTYTHGTNPVLRGLPLSIAGSAAATFGFIPRIFWSNAGFACLNKIRELDDHEARYDPTVIPMEQEPGVHTSLLNVGAPSYRHVINPGLRQYSAGAYHSAYERGELTPIAVAEALLNIISKSPNHKSAFLDIAREQVLEAAEESTKRYVAGKAKGLFDGVPVAVKDEVDLHGHRKTLGSCKDFTNPENATSWCVRKWEESGAIIVGKLNMHELGLDTTNNNPVTGTPFNPYNPHYYTGGSSGGSAYAVATGLLPVTLGVDGGGSVRIPSSFCGLFGLKPTHSRISRLPSVNVATSCSVIGPMASNMADLELAYRIMATPNPSDPASSVFPPPFSTATRQDQDKILGIYKPWFDVAEPSVLNACHAALAHYQSAGYKVIDIHLPFLPEGQTAHAMTILAEIGTIIHELSGFSPSNKIILSVGKQTPASDFLLAQKMRNLLMQHLAYLFKQHPGLLIVTPTQPDAGWHISGGAADLKHGVSDANHSVRNMTYVWLANFTGCPAITVPVGTAEPKEGKGKIPIGLMAMGEWGREEELMEWGRVGEAWAWKEGEERMHKPDNWVDVMEIAKGG